jgi:hypothetical protein
LPASNKRKILKLNYFQLECSQLDPLHSRAIENLVPNGSSLPNENVLPGKNCILDVNIKKLSVYLKFAILLFSTNICERL